MKMFPHLWYFHVIQMYYKRRYTPRRRYYKKKTYGNRTKKLSKPMAKAVKAVVYRQVETKWSYASCGTIGTQIFDANTPVTCNLLSAIVQGDGQQNRTGDKINVSNITFSATVATVPGSTVHWHMYIFRSTIYKNNATQFQGTSLGYSTFFKNVTGDCDIDIPDHEKVTILKHRRITQYPLNVTSGVNSSKIMVSLNMKKAGYQYASEAGDLGKNNNIYGLIVADSDQQSQILNGQIVVRFKDA